MMQLQEYTVFPSRIQILAIAINILNASLYTGWWHLQINSIKRFWCVQHKLG